MSETRAERRQRFLEDQIARAHARAATLGRTVVCTYPDRGRHVTCIGGDRCLCECHDDDEILS